MFSLQVSFFIFVLLKNFCDYRLIFIFIITLQKQTSRFEKKMMFLERIRENRKVAKDIFKSPSPIEMDYPEPEVLAHDYDDSICELDLHSEATYTDITI